MLELISQVDIEPHLLRMVRVVESSFKWTKHTVYPIGNGATEHILFFHDVVEAVAAERTVVLPRVEGDVMRFYPFEPGKVAKGTLPGQISADAKRKSEV